MSRRERFSWRGWLAVVLLMAAWPLSVLAECSPRIGHATINELHRSGQHRFIEVKLLNTNIPAATYERWSLDVCSSGTVTCGHIGLGDAAVDHGNYPWLVAVPAHRNYINFGHGGDRGMEVRLNDEAGRAIDYVSISGYTEGLAVNCDYLYDTAHGSTNAHTVMRLPDGVGDWGIRGPGNSGDNSEGGSNVPDPPSGPPHPRIDIENIDVMAGDDAEFTITVFAPRPGGGYDPANANSDIYIDYLTLDGELDLGGAVSPDHYEAIAGSVVIPQGHSSVTVSVPTRASAPEGSFFYLLLNGFSAAGSASVVALNHFGIATVTGMQRELDHVRIHHQLDELTCRPAQISVAACTEPGSDTGCELDRDTGLTFTLMANGTARASGGFDGGLGDVSFRQTTPAAVTLSADVEGAIVRNPPRCFSGAVETACSMLFHDSGLVFDIPPQTAGRPSAPVLVQALRAEPGAPASCAPAFDGPREVAFWFERRDPLSGGAPLYVNGTVVPEGAAGTPTPLMFDGNATALIELEYHDAGLLELHARYAGQGEDEGFLMLGRRAFVVRPAGLCVRVDTSASAASACESADPNCSVFRAAGEPFPLVVEAVKWENGGGGCGNAVTPGFRLDDIGLSLELIAPVDGMPGLLGESHTSLAAADAGSRTIPAQSISEVGVFRIHATPNSSYHGTSVPTGTSAPIGRFVPDELRVEVRNNPTLAPACGGEFTYLDQPFTFADPPSIRISAHGRDGNITRNYDGAWWRLPRVASTYAHRGATLPGTVALQSDAAEYVFPCTSGGCAGDHTFELPGQFRYLRGIEPVEPFAGALSADMAVEDLDGVAAAGNPYEFEVDFDVDANELRFGRLMLENAHGPELAPLSMGLYAEYFRGGGYRIARDDFCTEIPAAAVQLAPELNGGATHAQVVHSPALAGRADLNLSAPGAGYSGTVPVAIDLGAGATLPWLTFDWNEDGLLTGPSARATFGIYSGNPRLIDLREMY